MRYRDPRGAWRDAQVSLARVTGDLRRRAGAHQDFGYWVSFLPSSVARYYGGIPPRRADGPPAIRVIAYGPGGDVLGSYYHRN